MNAPRHDMPAPPAHVAAFVEVLGVDGAVDFLLAFGGAELYLTQKPRPTSRLSRAIGVEKAAELARMSARIPRRIPTAKPWLAQVLRARGLSVAEIARRLHVSDVSVRGWLKRAPGAGNGPGDTAQPDLFD